MKKILVTEVSLRDGSHVVGHQFTKEQVRYVTEQLSHAGVDSSFLRHAVIASEKYGVDARDILVELGKRKLVGGQEDMIIEVLQQMAEKKVSVS